MKNNKTIEEFEKINFLGNNEEGIFNYTFSFSLREDTLHNFRDSIPLSTKRQKNKEIVELYKFLFERELRKFLNKSDPNNKI